MYGSFRQVIEERKKIYLGPDSNRGLGSAEASVSFNVPLMKSGDRDSNPGRSRFFLLQLFVWKKREFFNLNIINIVVSASFT